MLFLITTKVAKECMGIKKKNTDQPSCVSYNFFVMFFWQFFQRLTLSFLTCYKFERQKAMIKKLQDELREQKRAIADQCQDALNAKNKEVSVQIKQVVVNNLQKVIGQKTSAKNTRLLMSKVHPKTQTIVKSTMEEWEFEIDETKEWITEGKMDNYVSINGASEDEIELVLNLRKKKKMKAEVLVLWGEGSIMWGNVAGVVDDDGQEKIKEYCRTNNINFGDVMKDVPKRTTKKIIWDEWK